MGDIEAIDRAKAEVQVDGMDRDQILHFLWESKQQVSDSDYKNTYWKMLHSTSNWDFATPLLFILLPSNDDSWVDSDPSTHQLRLCFLFYFWARNDKLDHLRYYKNNGK